MFQRRAFFANLTGLLGLSFLPKQASAQPKRKRPIVIDSYADIKRFMQYEVFDADTKEYICLPIFYADEGASIIRFYYRPWMKDRTNPDDGLENVIHTGTRFVNGHPWPWVETRRNIRVLKKLSDRERFHAQDALT